MSANVALLLAAVAAIAAVASFLLKGRAAQPAAQSLIPGGQVEGESAALAGAQVAVQRSVMDAALAMFVEYAIEAASVQQIGMAAAGPICEALQIPRVMLLRPDGTEWVAEMADTGEVAAPPPPDKIKLFARLAQNPEPVFTDGSGDVAMVDLARFYGADALLPLAHRGELLGILLLVQRMHGGAYRSEERAFLSDLQLEAAAAAANASFLPEIATRAKLASEVNVAVEVQQKLLPEKSDILLGGLRLAGHYRAGASASGSNFWTYHHLPDGRVLVLVGDVAGDGLAASMTAAVTLGACDVLLGIEEVPDAGRLMGQLNLALYLPDVKSWITCCAALFDHQKKTISFANAGHPFPYSIARRDGQIKMGSLVTRGPAVGDRPYGRFEPATHSFAKGDAFAFYTRGFVEHTDSGGKAYGEKRFQKALRSGAERELDARGLRDKILLDVTSWARGAPGKEDEVLVVVRAE